MIAKRHIHFIGICGTAMAPVAKMFWDLGWRVTGSDKGIYPPISDYLKQNKIAYYVGFHPERIGNPDKVVVGNYISLVNPEFSAIRERGIPYQSYPEALREYVIKSNSIVVAGSFGKTTTTALLAWIWECAGRRPSFMAGGMMRNFPNSVRSNDSLWSIVEGDEYPACRWNPVPKFSFYDPHFLVLTGVQWDHADIYTTEESYIEMFKKLVASMPPNGLICAALDRPHMRDVLNKASAPVVWYGRTGSGADWSTEVLYQKKATKMTFYGPSNETIGPVSVPLLGSIAFDHFTGAVALARASGIDQTAIMQALTSFQGVCRRLEVRGVVNKVSIIDDFAHSPSKAKSAIDAVKQTFNRGRVIVVFEPNVGNRLRSLAPSYRDAFNSANTVIVPRLSATKHNENTEARLDGAQLAQIISSSNTHIEEVVYIDDDIQVVQKLQKIAQPGDCILFLGSHGFRGMIEQTLECL
ncbi:MAG: Mur ligase domain-containing protein [Patescibacteria group bacterium]